MCIYIYNLFIFYTITKRGNYALPPASYIGSSCKVLDTYFQAPMILDTSRTTNKVTDQTWFQISLSIRRDRLRLLSTRINTSARNTVVCIHCCNNTISYTFRHCLLSTRGSQRKVKLTCFRKS